MPKQVKKKEKPIRLKRLYRKDFKRPGSWTLLLWDQGHVRVSHGVYPSEGEAEDALMRWNRVVGRDNHPVYAMCVVPYYANRERYMPRRAVIKGMEKMLAKLQAERLALIELQEKAERFL